MTDKKHKHHSHHAHHAPHHRKKKTPVGKYVFGIIVFVVLVAVVAGLIYLSTKAGESRTERESKVAAVVNGEQIMTEYLDEQYSRVPVQYQAFITKATLLNQTINEVLLLQEAESKGVDVTTSDVQAEIKTAMDTAGITKSQLKDRLAEQNMTPDFLEELYRKQLTINNLLEDTVFTELDVDKVDIQNYYDSKIRAMHILVDEEEDAEAIITKLKRVSRSKLEAEFKELAESESKDPSAATNSGDLGEFGKGQMVPEFEMVAFSLDEYGFTETPVKSQFGYHVIMRLPKEETLEDQYAAIEELLLSQKKAQAVPLYVEQLRSKAQIQVIYKEPMVPIVPAAPTGAVVAEPVAVEPVSADEE
ncbi:peptidylprolyl isomerase [Nanoarchaeota archaeon]